MRARGPRHAEQAAAAQPAGVAGWVRKWCEKCTIEGQLKRHPGNAPEGCKEVSRRRIGCSCCTERAPSSADEACRRLDCCGAGGRAQSHAGRRRERKGAKSAPWAVLNCPALAQLSFGNARDDAIVLRILCTPSSPVADYPPY